MTSAGRWTIVVMILGVAGIIALWPRDQPQDDGATPVDLSGSKPTAQMEADATLAPLRRSAAAPPCPVPSPDAPDPSGPLAGVIVPCLGAPGTVDLGAALAGKATLLNLWASWCGPCREEMPVLASYAEQSDAIPVLGVNVLDRASDGLRLMAELGVNYPSIADPEEVLQRALAVPPVLPVNYLVLPDGSVQRITDPVIFDSPDQVREAVQRHLDVQP